MGSRWYDPYIISIEIITEYLKESGVPRTSLYTGAYIENFLNPMLTPKKIGEDTYLLPFPILPDCKIFFCCQTN